MAFSPVNVEKEAETKEAVKKLNWTMYAPQIIMLAVAFILGIYLPNYLANLITNTVG
jgi:multisubunit Na+/H+ antiporter MnhB subunit